MNTYVYIHTDKYIRSYQTFLQKERERERERERDRERQRESERETKRQRERPSLTTPSPRALTQDLLPSCEYWQKGGGGGGGREGSRASSVFLKILSFVCDMSPVDVPDTGTYFPKYLHDTDGAKKVTACPNARRGVGDKRGRWC
jgi:hypothetical protein